jgi:hypothetical protein
VLMIWWTLPCSGGTIESSVCNNTTCLLASYFLFISSHYSFCDVSIKIDLADIANNVLIAKFNWYILALIILDTWPHSLVNPIDYSITIKPLLTFPLLFWLFLFDFYEIPKCRSSPQLCHWSILFHSEPAPWESIYLSIYLSVYLSIYLCTSREREIEHH